MPQPGCLQKWNVVIVHFVILSGNVLVGLSAARINVVSPPHFVIIGALHCAAITRHISRHKLASISFLTFGWPCFLLKSTNKLCVYVCQKLFSFDQTGHGLRCAHSDEFSQDKKSSQSICNFEQPFCCDFPTIFTVFEFVCSKF